MENWEPKPLLLTAVINGEDLGLIKTVTCEPIPDGIGAGNYGYFLKFRASDNIEIRLHSGILILIPRANRFDVNDETLTYDGPCSFILNSKESIFEGSLPSASR